MAPEEVDLWADALLLKIHAITGWVVPDGTMLTVFSDQLRKKIAESYANVNAEEIEYAFRNYGTMVPDWGKQMNLAMIDQVMVPYLERRAQLSRLEEQKTPAFKPPAIEEDTSEKAMTDWMEEIKARVKAGNQPMTFMPLSLYDWMDKKGLIIASREEKAKYLVMAADCRQGQLVEAAENEPSPYRRDNLSKFIAMKESGEISGEEIAHVKNLAKKMVMFEMFGK